MWTGNISYIREAHGLRIEVPAVGYSSDSYKFLSFDKHPFSLFRLAFFFIDDRMLVEKEQVTLDSCMEAVGSWVVLNMALAAKNCCGGNTGNER